MVSAYNIPHDLIINIDQTYLPFVLVSNYTLSPKGNKKVAISNCTDYRQITGTFGIRLNGEFLPIQLIYQGKTERCHPKFKFPEEFHVTHTKNHWSNEEKSKELVTNQGLIQDFSLGWRRGLFSVNEEITL